MDLFAIRGIQLKSESEINRSLEHSIEAINKLPSNSPVNIVSNNFIKTEFIAEPVLFSNNIAFNNGNTYPSMFTSYSNFLKSPVSKLISFKRGIFLKNHDSLPVLQLTISANRITFNIYTPGNDTIVLLQNYNRNWSGFIDNAETKIQQFNQTFISIPVLKGNHFIELKYFPLSSVIAFWGSLAGWLMLITIIIKYKRQDCIDNDLSNKK